METATATKPTTAIWTSDTDHSDIKFIARHMVISKVTGHFDEFEATVNAAKDDFSDAEIKFKAKVDSINTGKADRDGHLKSDDFFNAQEFPFLSFKSKTVEKTGEFTYNITGDLTIRDVVKPIALQAEYGGTIIDPYGNERAGFNLRGKVNRFDYGLKWNALLETGGAVVGENITLDMDVEIVKER